MKAKRRIKRPGQCELPLRSADGNWARNEAEKTAFAKHVQKVFFAHLMQIESRLLKISMVTPKGSLSSHDK